MFSFKLLLILPIYGRFLQLNPGLQRCPLKTLTRNHISHSFAHIRSVVSNPL